MKLNPLTPEKSQSFAVIICQLHNNELTLRLFHFLDDDTIESRALETCQNLSVIDF